MSDFISREEARKLIMTKYDEVLSVGDALDCIDAIPAADVVERKRKPLTDEQKAKNAERNRKYVEEHREQIREYQRQYREKNREKINTRMREYQRERRKDATAKTKMRNYPHNFTEKNLDRAADRIIDSVEYWEWRNNEV